METESNGQIIRTGRGAETVGAWLNKNRDQIKLAAPRGANADRLMRIFATELQRVPKLVECTSASLIGGFLTASQLGLEIGSALGQAWLIPFKNRGTLEATLIIGYKGFVSLAYQSGIVYDVSAEAVYENDPFEYRLGTDPRVDHLKSEGDRGALRAAYCVAWVNNAARPKVTVVTRSEVEKIKRSARGAQRSDSPWNQWEDQMWSKTAIRRACKTLPQTPASAALHTAITIDEQGDANLPQQFATLPEVADEPERVEQGPPMRVGDAVRGRGGD
jgi:recombination protein RecT